MNRKGLLTALVGLTVASIGAYVTSTTYDPQTNAAPVMGNIADIATTFENAVAISGSCTDDGKPPPSSITYQWTQVSGPTVTLGSSTSASTTATPALTAGPAVLRLTCCDQGPAAACTGLSASKTFTLTVNDPFTVMTTAVAANGSTLYDFWEVARTDDATIDVQSGAVASIVNGVGGRNALAQATAGSRPAYMTTGGGAAIRNEPFLRLDTTARTMSANAAVAQGYYGLYLVARPGVALASGTRIVSNPTHASSGTSQLSWVGASAAYNINTSFAGSGNVFVTLNPDAAGTVARVNSVSTPEANRWRLFAIRALSTGALSQINGVTTTPNFSSTAQLNALQTYGLGFSGSSMGDVKMALVVSNPDATTDAAIQAYVQARWPGIYSWDTDNAWIIFSGQSNNTQAIRGFTRWAGVEGYALKLCALTTTGFLNGSGPWAPGQTLRNECIAMAAAAPAGKRVIFDWAQGESDSDSSTNANPYGAEQTAFFSALRAARPNIYIIDTRFHATFLANGTFPAASTVNNAKIAGTGADLVQDPNTMSGALQGDGIHYDNTLSFSHFAAVATVASGLPPTPRRRPPPKRPDGGSSGRNVVSLADRRRKLAARAALKIAA